MDELFLQQLNEMFPDKAVLTLDELAQFIRCSPDVVYNYTRRSDPKRRPPRLPAGKEVRFPKRPLARWLAEEAGA